MPAKAEATTIPCTTPQALQVELDALSTALSLKENEDNWEKLERALIRFTAVTRGGGYKHLPFFTEGLGRKENGPAVISAMLSERGRLSSAATDLLQTFAPRLSMNFAPLVPIYTDGLMKLLARPNKVIYKRTEKCLTTIIGNCHIPAIVYELKKGLTDEAPTMRRGCAAGMEKAVKEWDNEIWGEKGLSVLEDSIKKIAKDKDPEVRQTGKRVWALYSETWPERVEEFSAPLTPTLRRYLDIANPGVPGRSKAAAPSRPLASAPSSKILSSQAESGRPATQRVLSNPAHMRLPPAPEAGPSQPRSRPASPRRPAVPASTAAAVPLPDSPPFHAVATRPQLADRPAVPPIPAKYGRSVSHQILPTMSLQRSPSSHDAVRTTHASGPVRPPFAPSYTSASLASSQISDSSNPAAAAPPRRFAPPVRIPRQVLAVEEDLDVQYATPLNPSVLRGPSRPVNLGVGKKALLGPAQRRVVTAPGSNAEYVLVESITPVVTLGRSLGKGIRDRIEKLEKAASPQRNSPGDTSQGAASRPGSAQPSPSRPPIPGASPAASSGLTDADRARATSYEEVGVSPRASPRPASALGIRREDLKVVSPLRVPLARAEPAPSPMFPVHRKYRIASHEENEPVVEEAEEEEDEEMLQDVTNGQMADLTILEDGAGVAPETDTKQAAAKEEELSKIDAVEEPLEEPSMPSVTVLTIGERAPEDQDQPNATGVAQENAVAISPAAAEEEEKKINVVDSPSPSLAVSDEIGVRKVAQPDSVQGPSSVKAPDQTIVGTEPVELSQNTDLNAVGTELVDITVNEEDVDTVLTNVEPVEPVAAPAPAPATVPALPAATAPGHAPAAPKVKSTLSTSTSRAPLAAIKAKPPLVPTKSMLGSQAVPIASKPLPKVDMPRKPPVPKARAVSERRPFKPTSSALTMSAAKQREALGKTRTVSGSVLGVKLAESGDKERDVEVKSSEHDDPGQDGDLTGESTTTREPRPAVPVLLSSASSGSAPLPKANSRPAPALPSTVSRSGATQPSGASGSAPPSRVTSARAVSANSAQAKSTVTLPPVKRERIKRKASLPKFKPVKRAGAGAGPAAAVNGAPVALTAPTKGVVAKVKPEMVALPPSPVPGARPQSRTVLVAADIPLPSSPVQSSGKASSLSVHAPAARAPSPLTTSRSAPEAVSMSNTAPSPLPSKRCGSGTGSGGKSGSPISVGVGRPLSPLLTTGPAELPSPPPGSPVATSIASPHPRPAAHVRAHTEPGTSSPASIRLIDHPTLALARARSPRVLSSSASRQAALPSSLRRSDRPRVHTAMSLYAATEAGGVDSSDDDGSSDEDDTLAGVQFQSQPAGPINHSNRPRVRNLAEVHQSPSAAARSPVQLLRGLGPSPEAGQEADLIEFSAPSRPLGAASAPTIVTSGTPIKLHHAHSGIKTQLSTPSQHSRDVLLKLAAATGGGQAGSTTPLDSPRRVLVVRDANLEGKTERARVLVGAGGGSVSGSDMEDA